MQSIMSVRELAPSEVMSYPLLVRNGKYQTPNRPQPFGQLRTEWAFLQQKRLTKALNGNSQRPDVNHSARVFNKHC